MSQSMMIEGNLSIVKKAELEDENDFINLVTDNENNKFSPFQTLDRKTSMEAFQKFIKKQDRETLELCSVWDKKNNQCVGFIGIQPITYKNKLEKMAFINFNKKVLDSDLLQEAIKLFGDWIFKNQKIDKIVCVIHPRNKHSIQYVKQMNANFDGEIIFGGAIHFLYYITNYITSSDRSL